MRKTKSGHGSGCGRGDDFSEKKESRNISLHSFFFSLPFVIAMTLVTIKTSTDHRERITPFEKLKRYLAPTKNIRPFPVAIIIFFIAIPCIPCTFAQSGQGITSHKHIYYTKPVTA
ncbi:hypothetical protein, partial [uncultured Muribaculum sp.]|uniref:hypothetical protein n=1 Tax=uncultured Muribaculum sp. TaxID=1918613 RepID=UPI0025B09569